MTRNRKTVSVTIKSHKSRLVTTLLALFLGWLGIYRF